MAADLPADPPDTAAWTAKLNRRPRRSHGAVAVRLLLMSLSGGSMLGSLALLIIGHAWLAGGVLAGTVLGSALLLMVL